MGVLPISKTEVTANAARRDVLPIMDTKEAIGRYAWLVAKLANQYLRAGVDVEDLVQEGYLGLLRACKEWKPDAGKSFETFAAQRIRNALRDFLVRERIGSERAPSVSMDARDDEGLTLHETVGEDGQQEEYVGRRERVDAVREAVCTLSASDRALIGMWSEAGDVPTVARQMGMCRITVHKRFAGAKRRLAHEVAPFVDEPRAAS